MSRPMVLTACAMALVASLSCAQPEEAEGQTMEFQYGFRYDPMQFVQESDSLQAALIRRHVFRNPKREDAALLARRVDEILAEQREDGMLGDRGHGHASRLAELADCGADRGDPRVQRAIEASLRGDPEEDGEIWVRDLRGLCLFGATDHPNVKRSLQAILDREEEWNGPYKICPWGQAFYLRALWPAREIIDTTECCRRTLRWMLDGLNDAGCVSYKDPWGLVWCAGIIDLPEARQLIERLVPTILRGQDPDGSWGAGAPHDAWSKASVKVYEALVNHGLFDTLRGLPPLPPDWRIVREIPAPAGDLRSMTWDGARLWVMDRQACEAIAVSPDDGTIQERVTIPFEEPRGIGWWDGGLAVAQNGPKRVVKLDPETGGILREVPVDKPDWCEVSGVAEVEGRLWINDDFNGVIRRVDPESGAEPTLHGSAGSLPCSLTPVPGGVWEIDAFSPYLLKSDRDAGLLDCGENPFGGRCDGLAWDGEHLWALDNREKRICIIERADAGETEEIEDAPAAARAGVRREGERVWIEEVPLARGKGNGYVRGLESILAHAGTPVSYERLMGLSGLAFIAQADVEHVWDGKVDVGWWPLDPWGLALRREFLGQAIGYELREVGALTLTPDECLAVRDRLPQAYRERVGPHVEQSIDAGRPVLAMCDFGFVITGYDGARDRPPLLGRCGCDTEREGYPIESWPLGVIMLGKPSEPMDTDAADLAALRYAVELGHDRAGPYEAQWCERRFTGQKAFAAWASVLRDVDQPVEDRHHANMRLNLQVNRTAAVAYLRSVANRREGGAAEALSRAVASYEAVLGHLSQINPSGLSSSPEARRGLADLVDRIAAVEAEATRHLEAALIQMTAGRDDDESGTEIP